MTPLSLDACLRRLRNGVILLRVLSTSTVAGVSTSCCWALASGVSVGRGDSAIAGCPLRSQPPPPMQARHCANICPGGRTPSVFGHAVSSITPGGGPVPYLSLLAEELPACTNISGATCAVKSRAWGLAGAKCSPAAARPPRQAERALLPSRCARCLGLVSLISIDVKSSSIVRFCTRNSLTPCQLGSSLRRPAVQPSNRARGSIRRVSQVPAVSFSTAQAHSTE